ncbi:MAG: DUF4337 domain-containing protein [Reyranellaceae bacterium]
MAGHGHAPHEQAEHAEHHGASNKQIALLISILALLLAVSETLGKAAQTTTLAKNIEAANLWGYFQGKTVRLTVVRAQIEDMQIHMQSMTDAAQRSAAERAIEHWKRQIARYESDPKENDGRKELTARAKAAEKKRDDAEAKHHHYEMASAAIQIAIVLASAAIITGIAMLTWFAMGLGVVGAAFAAIGLFAPHAVHLF